VKLSDLLIKDSLVYDLKFELSDINGDNRIEGTIIWGILYGKSKIRNLTIANCTFNNYINIALSEFTRLKLSNNTYTIQKSGEYEGKVRYRTIGDKYIDSDKFPSEQLEPVPIPKDHWYLK
jgi:hypothetical protein